MDEKETQEAGRRMLTGFQWEAMVYLEAFRSIRKRYGVDAAKEIMKETMYNAGITMGRLGAEEVDCNDIRGMKQMWDIMYPPVPEDAVDVSDEKFVFTGGPGGCAIYNTFISAGVGEEELADLADGFCVGDVSFATGFNENMVCEQTQRIMVGSDHCVWVHTMKNK